MARILHTAVAVPGSQNFTGTVITLTAATPASDEEVVLTGTEMILAQNTDSGAQTVTVTSVNDPFGRTKDIAAVSMAASEFRIFGPFNTTGWAQTNGKLNFEASDALVKFVVFKLALP